MMTSGKTALVVSGGGAKGAFAVGVVKQLFSSYRHTGWFRITGGTSTGAIIAPMAALMGAQSPVAEQALNTLVHLYSNVTTPDILERQEIFEFLRRRDCLNETDPLNDLLHRHLTQAWFDWLQGPQAPHCYVVYTNYQTGQKVVVSPKDDGMTRERFIQAMLASASVPVVMEAAVIDGAACYDGGVRDLLPFGEAIKLGAETIVPVFLSPERYAKTTRRFSSIDKILLKTLDILVDEAERNDFEMASLINIAIRARREILSVLENHAEARQKVEDTLHRPEFQDLFGPEKRLINIITGLRPDGPLTEDSLTFEPTKMRMWMDWGEQKAREVIKESPFA